MGHCSEDHLDQVLSHGLSDLLAWDGNAVDILPLINWEGLWSVTIARLCYQVRSEAADSILRKLYRLERLAAAYASYVAWETGGKDARAGVLGLARQGRVSLADMRAISMHFIGH